MTSSRPTPDMALTAALTACALAAWSSTYDSYSWIVVALIGLALGLGVSVFTGARNLSMWIHVPALLGLYVLTAGMVATQSPPGVTFIGDSITATISCWADLAGTHPTVAGEGTLLLPPYAVALLGSGLAGGLALHTRRVVVPVLPLVVAFGVVLVLGRQGVTALPYAVAFGVVALVWVGLRGRRVVVHPGPAADTWGLRLERLVPATVVLALAAGSAYALTGDAGDPAERLLLRNSVGAYDAAAVPTPLDGFRQFTDQPGAANNLHDRLLLTLRGAPEGSRVRFATLDQYDGRHWYAGNGTDPSRYDDRYLHISGHFENPASGPQAYVSLRVTPDWNSPWVPLVGAPQSVDAGLTRSGRSRLDEMRINLASTSALMTSDLTARDQLEYDTRIPDDRFSVDSFPSTFVEPTAFEQADYFGGPILVWTKGSAFPMQALMRAARVLRTEGYYSDGSTVDGQVYLAGQSTERLGKGFVYAPRMVGNDEQYAALMALIASRLRIPARVVVGAVVPEDGQVFGRDVQAWIEVRTDDEIWRTIPTETFMSRRPPPRTDAPPPTFSVPRNVDTDEEVTEPDPQRDEQARQDERDRSDPPLPRWPLALLPVLLVGGVLVAKWWRRRRRRRATRASLRFAGAWQELVDRARDLGLDVPARTTRPAQAAALGVDPGLAIGADARIFAADEPDDDDADAYWDQLTAVRREVGEPVPRWRRAMAWVNPRSLLRHRG